MSSMSPSINKATKKKLTRLFNEDASYLSIDRQKSRYENDPNKIKEKYDGLQIFLKTKMVQFQVIKSTLDRLVKLLKIQTLGLQRVPENPTRTMYYPTRPEHEF